MACYHPLHVFQQVAPAASGKRPLSFNVAKCSGNPSYVPVTIPCGQCSGCRFERSRQWAVRCMHEASLHQSNCVITLTYAPENLPSGGSLTKRHVQLFLKRLRKKFPGTSLSYYYCGEYGARFARPHYHICLFGLDFTDRVFFQRTKIGTLLYRSATLESLWIYGFSTVGDLTFNSAAYVARYIMKKIFGPKAIDHYNLIDYTTGEVIESKLPEYTNMSLKPAIGKGWITLYMDSVYRIDGVIVKGVKSKPPKYYDGMFELFYPEDFIKIKAKRKEAAELLAQDNSGERLAVKERFFDLTKLQKFQREYENE